MSQRVSDPDLQVSGVPADQYQAAAVSCCPRVGLSSWEVGALCSAACNLCEAGASYLGAGPGSARWWPHWGPQGDGWGLWAPGDAGVDPQDSIAQGSWGHSLSPEPQSSSHGGFSYFMGHGAVLGRPGLRFCPSNSSALQTAAREMCAYFCND